jgi:uncharacterized protein
MFIGRKRELEELEERYRSPAFEFGLIYGTRRIGKTRLIDEFIEGKRGFRFQAKKDNAYGNLRSFSLQLNPFTGMPASFVYSSWEEAFNAIRELSKNERFILSIDEYPYIVSQERSFPSVLQDFADRSAKEGHLMLLLSGSNLAFMKKEIQESGGELYKRKTFAMEIKPLPFSEAKSFFPWANAVEKANYLSLFGFSPYYLALINGKASFEENIQKLLFNPFGTLIDAPDDVLSDGIREPSLYNSILKSIANGNHRIRDIAQNIHEEETKISKYIGVLLDAGMVSKRPYFSGSKNEVFNEIGDPLLAFYYRFVFDELPRIQIGLGSQVFEEEKAEIYHWLSQAFEGMANHFLEEENQKGKFLAFYPPLTRFVIDNSALHRSVEFDGISATKDHALFVECKDRNALLDREIVRRLMENASLPQFAPFSKKEFALVSKSGFTPEAKGLESETVHLYSLEEMMAE